MVESRGLDVGAARGRTSRRGFSILEMLVVVAVLALLVAVMVFAVRDSGKSGASTSCALEETRVENALASYKQLTGAYPPNLVVLTHQPHRLLKRLPEHHLLSETPGQVVGTGQCAR